MSHKLPHSDAPTGVAPPHAQLIQMATAYWVSRAVYAAAKLDLADHLAGGPKSAADLAVPTSTHGPSLHRLMRALASLGVLSEDTDQRFALTALGEGLRRGATGSARATILALAGNWWWRGWEHILHSLETGETGMERASGTTVFDYLAHEPQEASYFNDAMIGFHGEEPHGGCRGVRLLRLRDCRRCRRRDRQSSGRHSRAPSPGAWHSRRPAARHSRSSHPHRAPRLYRSRHNRGNRLFRKCTSGR